MKFPHVSNECMLATVQKTMDDFVPETFALQTMFGMAENQQFLSLGLNKISADLMQGQDENVQNLMVMAFWVAAGLTCKAINAQMEVDELDEQWS